MTGAAGTIRVRGRLAYALVVLILAPLTIVLWAEEEYPLTLLAALWLIIAGVIALAWRWL